MPFVYAEAAPYLIPTLICFAIGFAASLLDFHERIVRNSNNTRPMSYFMSGKAALFFISIGSISVILFTVSLYTEGGWIDRRLGLAGASLPLRGFIVGTCAVVLLRSRIAEIRDLKLGPELGYELLRGWAVDGYKMKAATKKLLLAALLAPEAAKIDHFDEDLMAMVRDANNHKDSRGGAAAGWTLQVVG